ncbi:phage terminase small subunit [Nocardia farcinica]
MPPLPKHPSVRARRNRASTRAFLTPVEDPQVPELPAYAQWHPAVLEWWTDCWSSPMVPEWTESDRHALVMAARLMQLVWSETTAPTARTNAASEVRYLLRECGLTPMSRRSLQWEVCRAEEAVERTSRRRGAGGSDPRLTMMKGGV